MSKGGGWQLIETAPKDGSTILVWVYESKYGTARWVNGYWTIYRLADDPHLGWMGKGEQWLVLAEPPTHWQPLPKPPEPKP